MGWNSANVFIALPLSIGIRQATDPQVDRENMRVDAQGGQPAGPPAAHFTIRWQAIGPD